MTSSKPCILISSFGTTWEVVPELLGFLQKDAGGYRSHPQYEKIKLQRNELGDFVIQEIWLISTKSNKVLEAYQKLENYLKQKAFDISLRLFSG